MEALSHISWAFTYFNKINVCVFCVRCVGIAEWMGSRKKKISHDAWICTCCTRSRARNRVAAILLEETISLNININININHVDRYRPNFADAQIGNLYLHWLNVYFITFSCLFCQNSFFCRVCRRIDRWIFFLRRKFPFHSCQEHVIWISWEFMSCTRKKHLKWHSSRRLAFFKVSSCVSKKSRKNLGQKILFIFSVFIKSLILLQHFTNSFYTF